MILLKFFFLCCAAASSSSRFFLISATYHRNIFKELVALILKNEVPWSDRRKLRKTLREEAYFPLFFLARYRGRFRFEDRSNVFNAGR
jgi:hypothetical protein